jgi:hypothetical protein
MHAGLAKVTLPGMVFGAIGELKKCRVVQYLKTGSFQPFFEMRRHAHAPARRVRMSSPAATGLLSCYLRVSFRLIQTRVFLTRF